MELGLGHFIRTETSLSFFSEHMFALLWPVHFGLLLGPIKNCNWCWCQENTEVKADLEKSSSQASPVSPLKNFE